MPRTARSIVAGVCYHALSRNNLGVAALGGRVQLDNFLLLIAEAQRRVELDLLAVCLMPNHFHLVVRPRHDGDLRQWMHWLLTTHTHRFHRSYGSRGRIWQGRFKAFAIQRDEHLVTVLRYVERNALRANLVDRAEDWAWGSLAWRIGKASGVRLADAVVRLPSDWVGYVNSAQSARELDELRACVNRQRPYGTTSWVQTTARELGVQSSLGCVGRPRVRTA